MKGAFNDATRFPWAICLLKRAIEKIPPITLETDETIFEIGDDHRYKNSGSVAKIGGSQR